MLTSFPRAMLIMAAAFGFWRARPISNALFAAGIAAAVLVWLGATTWLSGGILGTGVYSRFVSPSARFGGIVVSRVLLASPITTSNDSDLQGLTVLHLSRQRSILSNCVLRRPRHGQRGSRR
jgi:hypothetical protein